MIGRGVERRPIFRTDRDREDFLARLATVVEEEDLRLFAFVLMGNHFHLVVRRDGSPLGHVMKRVLAGYGVAFNLRHRRSGHLFENRYKAVLCQEDAYLLQLVRYVHLNPVRAKMVSDPGAYLWSSHLYYLRRKEAPPWLDVETVLGMLGSRSAYRRFIADGMTEGERSDLCGRGGRGRPAAEPVKERRLWLGGQILGSERFARRALKGTRKEELGREMQRDAAATDLPSLAADVARRFEMDVAVLRGRGARCKHQRRTARAGAPCSGKGADEVGGGRAVSGRATVEHHRTPASAARRQCEPSVNQRTNHVPVSRW